MLHVSAYQNADTLAFFKNADTLAFLIWKSVTVPAVFKDTPKKTKCWYCGGFVPNVDMY